MIEDLLTQKETSKSILIIDSFDNKSENLLYTYITKFIEKDNLNTRLNLYPTTRTSKLKFVNLFSNDLINHTILNNLFRSKLNLFKLVLDDLERSSDEHKHKFCLLIDNLNLLLRHFDNNPVQLLQFLIQCSRRSDVVQIVMVCHKESIEESVLNQLKLVFQTVVNLIDTKMKQTEITMFSKLNKQVLKFNLKIEHRNLKSAKVLTHDEILFIDHEYSIQKVEKQIKTKTIKDEEDEDMLKGLTFNVHLSSDDLEAKKNLVLPYELIGQKKQVVVEKREEEAKIFYAPDEGDDVDDDDPDDDLNF